MRIVLDTNVLVSGLITPFGVTGEIVRMIASPTLTLCVDVRILSEYEEVLKQPLFRIETSTIEMLMDYIRSTAEIHPTLPLSHRLPDEDDEPFLEVALSAKADFLVTGNLKHYPSACRAGVKVISPGEFLDYCRKRSAGDR